MGLSRVPLDAGTAPACVASLLRLLLLARTVGASLSMLLAKDLAVVKLACESSLLNFFRKEDMERAERLLVRAREAEGEAGDAAAAGESIT